MTQVGEGLMAGTMTFFWTVLGIIYLLMFFYKKVGYTWMNWTTLACLILTIPFVASIKEEFRRTDVDNKDQEIIENK